MEEYAYRSADYRVVFGVDFLAVCVEFLSSIFGEVEKVICSKFVVPCLARTGLVEEECLLALGDALVLMVLDLPEEGGEYLSVALCPAGRNESPAEEVVSVHELLPCELFVAQSVGARAVGCGCAKREAVVAGFATSQRSSLVALSLSAAWQRNSVKYHKGTYSHFRSFSMAYVVGRWSDIVRLLASRSMGGRCGPRLSVLSGGNQSWSSSRMGAGSCTGAPSGWAAGGAVAPLVAGRGLAADARPSQRALGAVLQDLGAAEVVPAGSAGPEAAGRLRGRCCGLLCARVPLAEWWSVL
jgi:hypothetical protein